MNAQRPDWRRVVAGVLLAAALMRWVAGCLVQEAGRAWAAEARERRVLYNGIALPADWPPRMQQLPRDPVTPPYLASPPAVIPIDLGRQLLVDDFLIQELYNLDCVAYESLLLGLFTKAPTICPPCRVGRSAFASISAREAFTRSGSLRIVRAQATATWRPAAPASTARWTPSAGRKRMATTFHVTMEHAEPNPYESPVLTGAPANRLECRWRHRWRLAEIRLENRWLGW